MKTINPAAQNACPYDVGDILTTKNPKLPSERWPGTTWAAISDRFLLGAGASYPAGSAGGQSAINLQHAHATANHTLTVDEMPSHNHANAVHSFLGGGAGPSAGVPGGGTNYITKFLYNTGGGLPHNHSNTNNALSAAQNIMPPYTAVYIWERTA